MNAEATKLPASTSPASSATGSPPDGLAPVYADAFVTADGGLNEVLRLGERRPPDARAELLRSVCELDQWLCRLESGG